MAVYTTQGTCSCKISFDIIDGKIHNVSFMGGCNGNLKGISALIEGRPALEVIDTLQGITVAQGRQAVRISSHVLLSSILIRENKIDFL